MLISSGNSAVFTVSFDSKDDDDGEPGADLLRVPHWVAQEVRRWEPPEDDHANDKAWCLDTLKKRPTWFTDTDLFASGVAPNDDSYKNSGFDRGHMAMKLLVERLGQDAAYNTHTVLNAYTATSEIQSLYLEKPRVLDRSLGAKNMELFWVIQGPVFYPDEPPAGWIGDEGERKIAVPDAAFKIVVRYKTEEEGNKAVDRDGQTLEISSLFFTRN